MTLGMNAALRSARGDAYTTFAGNASLFRIYDGSRPATGGTATTLLAELTCGSPFADGASSVVTTANAITQDSSANATGTATWFRHVKSDGTTHITDGSVGTSGSDLNLVTTSIVATQPVQVSSWVLTEGNA